MFALVLTAGCQDKILLLIQGGLGHKSIFVWIDLRYNQNIFTVSEFSDFKIFAINKFK